MSRLDVKTPSQSQAVVEQLYRNMEQRIAASPPGLCPVDMALNFLNLCQAQTCGKCVPCRIGLTQLSNMIREVLEGEPEINILARIEGTAKVIRDTADCAIGIDAANLVLMGIKGFRDDYEEHILHHRCLGSLKNPVPCVALCPAGVDIPANFAAWNNMHIYRSYDVVSWAWENNIGDKCQAKNCIECGKCEKVCPQSISIREDLKKVQADLDSKKFS